MLSWSPIYPGFGVGGSPLCQLLGCDRGVIIVTQYIGIS